MLYHEMTYEITWHHMTSYEITWNHMKNDVKKCSHSLLATWFAPRLRKESHRVYENEVQSSREHPWTRTSYTLIKQTKPWKNDDASVKREQQSPLKWRMIWSPCLKELTVTIPKIAWTKKILDPACAKSFTKLALSLTLTLSLHSQSLTLT